MILRHQLNDFRSSQPRYQDRSDQKTNRLENVHEKVSQSCQDKLTNGRVFMVDQSTGGLGGYGTWPGLSRHRDISWLFPNRQICGLRVVDLIIGRGAFHYVT